MGPPPVIPFAFTRTLVILYTALAGLAAARTPSVATTATTRPKDLCVPVDIVVLLSLTTGGEHRSVRSVMRFTAWHLCSLVSRREQFGCDCRHETADCHFLRVRQFCTVGARRIRDISGRRTDALPALSRSAPMSALLPLLEVKARNNRSAFFSRHAFLAPMALRGHPPQE